jgi:tetratricopeptide (TPR) repeat protein
MTSDPGAAFPIFRIRIACALIVFIVSIVLYALTLAPSVVFVDSGELILAAQSLGVAHPPGFPLYVLLAHLATLVPISNVALRVNFASAIFAALASSVLALTVIEAITTPNIVSTAKRVRSRTDRSGKKGSSGAGAKPLSVSESIDPIALAVSSISAGLFLAFSRTLWAYATIAEVYTLNSLLILTIFLFIFRWRRLTIEHRARKEDRDRSDRWLYAAAIVFGLGLGVHHVTVGLMLPALGALVLATEGVAFYKSRRLAYAALWALAGLSIYVYLPIAASRSPVMNWGDPRTFERFWWHVTGRQYQVFFVWSFQTMASQLGDFIKLAVTQFGPAWLPVAPALVIAGFVAIYRRDRALFWFLTLAVAADLIYCLGYEIAEDKDAYYLTSIMAATIAAGFGAHWLIKKVPEWTHLSSNLARYLAVASIALVLIIALVANLSYDNRSRYFIATDYLDNIYSAIEPGGMLLTRDWQVYSPSLYQREIEHRREDVVAIDVNQLRRSWYFDYLARAYPSTIEQARDKVDAFLEDLTHWERDPDLYQRDVMLNQRISSRFYEMILAFVRNHIRTAPVYVTLDIAANRDGTDSELTKALAGSYQLVPQGLIFQATEQRGFVQPLEEKLITRGLADGTSKFEDGDVVKLKVLPVYVTMFYNRGRYLAANGKHQQAIDAFKQAIELQPGFSAAQQGITESLRAIERSGAN